MEYEGPDNGRNRSPLDPETVAIKRVVALEGDVVKTREPYPAEIVTVPEGQVWVEGDESFHSMDSNYYGPVNHEPRPHCPNRFQKRNLMYDPEQIPKGLVTARVTHVVFPFARAGRIAEEFKGRGGAIIHRAS